MHEWTFRLCLLVACLVGSLESQEISVSLDDGTDLILHEDFTWEPGETGNWIPPGVFEVTLEDGRNLILHNDFTWRFLSGAAGEHIPLETAYAVGKARRETAEAAREDAGKEAIRRLAIQLETLVPGADLRTLSECVARQEKKEEVDEHSQSGWNVTVRIEVGREAIQSIMDCACESPAKRKALTAEPE